MRKAIKDTVETVINLGDRLTDTFKNKAERKIDTVSNTEKAVTLLSTVMTVNGRIQALTDVTEALNEDRVSLSKELAAVYGTLAQDTNVEVSKDAIKSIVNVAKYTDRGGEVALCLETLLDVATNASHKKTVCRAIQAAATIFMERTENADDGINKKFQALRSTDKENAPKQSMLLHVFTRVAKIEHVAPTVTAALDELQVAYDTSAIDKFKRQTNPKWGEMHMQKNQEKAPLALNTPVVKPLDPDML